MITHACLLKNYIFGALTHYNAGTLQDALIIHLGRVILLARRWRVCHELLGKEYRTPEMYYKGVLKGARLIAGECSKDVIFE